MAYVYVHDGFSQLVRVKLNNHRQPTEIERAVKIAQEIV